MELKDSGFLYRVTLMNTGESDDYEINSLGDNRDLDFVFYCPADQNPYTLAPDFFPPVFLEHFPRWYDYFSLDCTFLCDLSKIQYKK